jgi:hypothetical protein
MAETKCADCGARAPVKLRTEENPGTEERTIYDEPLLPCRLGHKDRMQCPSMRETISAAQREQRRVR